VTEGSAVESAVTDAEQLQGPLYGLVAAAGAPFSSPTARNGDAKPVWRRLSTLNQIEAARWEKGRPFGQRGSAKDVWYDRAGMRILRVRNVCSSRASTVETAKPSPTRNWTTGEPRHDPYRPV
jgi:hypothetical protein